MAHSRTVTCLSLSATSLFSGSYDNTIKEWRSQKQTPWKFWE